MQQKSVQDLISARFSDHNECVKQRIRSTCRKTLDQYLRALPAYGCRHSQLRLIHEHIMKTANVKKTFSKLEAGTARSAFGLALAFAVFRRSNADDLLELMHKVDIIAVAALVCNICDAVIRT